MSESLTAALRAWAEEQQISPADFARKMDYSYNHAYQILRGDKVATLETLGRLALKYGADAVSNVVSRMDGQVDLSPAGELPDSAAVN